MTRLGMVVVFAALVTMTGAIPGARNARGLVVPRVVAKDDKAGTKEKRAPKTVARKAARPRASRHLRVVATSTRATAEPESVVLARVAAALDEAIAHPSLSSGWLAAFLSARADLEQGVEASQRG